MRKGKTGLVTKLVMTAVSDVDTKEIMSLTAHKKTPHCEISYQLQEKILCLHVLLIHLQRVRNFGVLLPYFPTQV